MIPIDGENEEEEEEDEEEEEGKRRTRRILCCELHARLVRTCLVKFHYDGEPLTTHCRAMLWRKMPLALPAPCSPRGSVEINIFRSSRVLILF